MSLAWNTSPMLLLKRPNTDVKGIPPKLHVVFDLCECNKNTVKLTSLLSDMEGILCHVACKLYYSLIDGKDIYKQICIEPAHIEQTAMTTPDKNMVSLVMQQSVDRSWQSMWSYRHSVDIPTHGQLVMQMHPSN